ncbi:MAG TPA: DUF4386 domain-containing protein [Actinomycetes bacterium]|nr:DUF4386 domain-containing protein [Actinomycetes bacterium]
MDSTRRTALIAGVLFLITFVASIPAVFWSYATVLDDVNYVIGSGGNTRIASGALLEMVVIVANIGTAVVLFPILKRQNETLALSYVAARIIESTFIAVGILSLLTIVTLQQKFADGATGDEGTFVTAGQSLVATHDWTFILGPGFIVGIGNGLILGYLMYTSGLVPRRMAMLGLIGGPLIIISGIAVLFDVIEPGGPAQAIATIPEFFWELFLGLYLTFKGFKPAPIITGDHGRPGVTASPATG